MTQLELALSSGVSTRHLSFVETGRSSPGRQLLLRILDQLEVPSREQNELLLAAGHAPAFPQRSLADPDLRFLREALDRILVAHEPNPAVAFDRNWDLVAVNQPMRRLVALADVDAELLEPPVNLLRLGLHPRGFAQAVVNMEEFSAHFLARLQSQVDATDDMRLAELFHEVSSYPGVRVRRDPLSERADLLGNFHIRTRTGSELKLFGMFAAFDTPFEVTSSELGVELLFPADERTSAALAGGAV
jgi:transcriptional regulator with XRE-family HTH domain